VEKLARQRNLRGEGSRLRDELIEAAMRILDRSPAAQLSLRMVAKEAGIAAPSVYSQFADAQAMMAEIVAECWRQLGEAMSERAEAQPAGDPLARLKGAMVAYVRYAMERPSRYQLLFALQLTDAGQFPDMPGLLRPAYRNVLACVEELETKGAALPAADAVSATVLIMSLAHGRIGLAHLGPHRPGNAPPGVKAFVLDALDRMFAA
jgi:AcrR family transcriptional regulator